MDGRRGKRTAMQRLRKEPLAVLEEAHTVQALGGLQVQHSREIDYQVLLHTMDQRVPAARRKAIGSGLQIRKDQEVYQFLRLAYAAWRRGVGETRNNIQVDDVEWNLLDQLDINSLDQLRRKNVRDGVIRQLPSLIGIRQTRISVPATNIGAYPVQPGTIMPVIKPAEENYEFYSSPSLVAADIADIVTEAAAQGATRDELIQIATEVVGEAMLREPTERELSSQDDDLRRIERVLERGPAPLPTPTTKSPGATRYRENRIARRNEAIQKDLQELSVRFKPWNRTPQGFNVRQGSDSRRVSNEVTKNAVTLGLLEGSNLTDLSRSSSNWVTKLLHLRLGGEIAYLVRVLSDTLPRRVPESGLRTFLGTSSRQSSQLEAAMKKLDDTYGQDHNYLAQKLKDLGKSPILGLDYRRLPNFFTHKDLEWGTELQPEALAQAIDIVLMRGVLGTHNIRPEQLTDIDQAILEMVRAHNTVRTAGSLLGETDAVASTTQQSVVVQGVRDTNTPTEQNEMIDTQGLSLMDVPSVASTASGQPLGQVQNMIYAPTPDGAEGELRIIHQHSPDELVLMDRAAAQYPEVEDAILSQGVVVHAPILHPTIQVDAATATTSDYGADNWVQVDLISDAEVGEGSTYTMQQRIQRHGRFASRPTGPVAGVTWSGPIVRNSAGFRNRNQVQFEHISDGLLANTRLRNFQSQYVERHVNNSNVIWYNPDELPDDWITTGMGNVTFYDIGTQSAIGIGIQTYHIKIRMLIWRKDIGSLDFQNIDLDGLVDLATTSTTTTNIKRNKMLHEQTGDQVGIDETITSYMSVYTDIGGIHDAPSARGNRTGIKTWIDTTNNKRRAIGAGTSAFEQDNEPPRITVQLDSQRIGTLAWPQYEGTITGTEEGVDLGVEATVETEKVVLKPTIPVVDNFIPTRTDIRVDKTDMNVEVQNNVISEMMGVMPTIVEANVVSTTTTDNKKATQDDIPNNIDVHMRGAIESPFFVAGEVQLRVVGWVLQDPSFLCDVDTQDQWNLEFGKVYIQGYYPDDDPDFPREPRLVEVNVFQNYNFCVTGANPAEGANMNAEVFKELDIHRINFTIMFDRLVTVKTDSRSRLWTFDKTIEWITQERAELYHIFRGVDNVVHDVVAEGMRNRLVISYYPVPTVLPHPGTGYQFFNNWLGGTIVNFTSRWVYDRYIREDITREMLPEIPLEQIVE